MSKEFVYNNKFIKEHKKHHRFICTLTFILFSPFVLLQEVNKVMYKIIEKIIEALTILRNKTIKFYMYLVWLVERI